MVSTKTLDMMRRMSGTSQTAHNTPAADGTKAVDASVNMPDVPMVSTDWGDTLPVGSPADTVPGFRQPAFTNNSDYEETLPSSLDIFQNRPDLDVAESVRQITPADVLAHRVQEYQIYGTPNDRQKLKEAWSNPETKRIMDDMFGSKTEVDKLRSRNNSLLQKEEEIYAQKVKDHKRPVRNVQGGYAGIGSIMSNTSTTPTPHQELMDFRAAQRLLDRSDYVYDTQSKLKQEMEEMERGQSGETFDNGGQVWHGARAKAQNKKREKGDSWYERLGHGLEPRTADDAISMGWMETADLNRIAQISEKASRGESLTPGEQAMAQAYLVGLDAEAKLQFLGGATNWEKVGKFTGENAPFLVEMAITGGLGTAAANAAKGLARKGLITIAGKALQNRAVRAGIKGASSVIGSTAGGMVMAPFSNATWRNFADRTVAQYDTGRNAEGNFQATLSNPASLTERLGKSYINGTMETGSELLGTYIHNIKLFPNVKPGTTVGNIVERFRDLTEPIRNFWKTPRLQRMNDYLGDTFKWYGLPVETFTEEYSNLLTPLLTGEPEQLKEDFSSEAQWDLILGVVGMSAIMGTAQAPAVAADHIHTRIKATGKLRAIENTALRQDLANAMSASTQQEQAKRLSAIDWGGTSMKDRASAIDYIELKNYGDVSGGISEAMEQQEQARQHRMLFDAFANKDTGHLEQVKDNEGNLYFLAKGSLENIDADGVVFVKDPRTGKVFQKSVNDLSRDRSQTYEEYEQDFFRMLEAEAEVKEAEQEIQNIRKEAETAGIDPTPAIAAYKGIDLDHLMGQTVLLNDGLRVYVSRVYTDNGKMQIDALPLDASGEIQIDNNGNEVHLNPDVSDIASLSHSENISTGEVMPEQEAAVSSIVTDTHKTESNEEAQHEEEVSPDPPEKMQEEAKDIPRKQDGTPDYAAMEPVQMFNAIATDFGEEVAREEVANQIAINQKKIKQVENSRSEDINRRLANRKTVAELQEKIDGLRTAAGLDQAEAEDTTGAAESATAPKMTLRRQSQMLGDYLSLEDKILRDIAEGQKFRWTDNGSQRGLATELGFADSPGERKARFNILANNGITVDQYAERLEHDMDNGVIPSDWDADIRSSILDILSRVRSNREAFDAAMALRQDDPRTAMTELEARQQAEYYEGHRDTDIDAPANDSRPVPEGTFTADNSTAPQDDVPFVRSEADKEGLEQNLSAEHRQEVEKIVADLNRASGANAVVFSDIEELPEKVKKVIENSDPNHKYAPPKGFFLYGKAYINASEILDPDEVERVYHHEIGGHQAIEQSGLTSVELVALYQAIVDDIGIEHMRAQGISELDDAIDAYMEGEATQVQLGREYIAYATERFFSPALYQNTSGPAFSVDLSQLVTDATIKQIIESANRKHDGRQNITIKPTEQGRTRLHDISQISDAGERGNVLTSIHNSHGDLPGDSATSGRGDVTGRSVGTGQSDDQGTVSGQDQRGADRNQPGTVPAGETVADNNTEAETDDIRLRRSQQIQTGENTLIAVHNISEKNLKDAFELGGFPMPSIAITKADVGHTSFGDISLVFGKDTINPTNRRNKVYGEDAWTPTFPEIGLKVNEAVAEAVQEKVYSILGDLYRELGAGVYLNEDNLSDAVGRYDGDMAAAFADKDFMKYAYRKAHDTKENPDRNDKEYRDWINSLFEGIVEKRGIRNDKDLFTPMGNRRKWETLYDTITLDSIVKTMQKQAAKGGQGLFGGSIFGSAQSEYKSISEIRKAARERIKNASELDLDNERKAITDRLAAIRILGAGDSVSDVFTMVENIQDAVRHAHTPKGIFDYLRDFYPEMTMEVAGDIADIVKDIQKMSARYFEAKPYRAVAFDEVKLAVLPSDTEADIFEQLQHRNIPVKTYERGNEDQRRQIVADTTAELNIRFRHLAETNEVHLTLQETNERFNAELQQQIDGTLPQGHIYKIGMPSEALKAAGIPDLPIELSAERLAQKASAEYASKHPFELSEIENLPQALASPIAVFDSRKGEHSKVVLTELESKGNNFVAILRVQKKGPGWTEVEINDIRSLYPKDRVGGIVDWINNDLLRWVDKEKAARFLLVQGPNYLGNGENLSGRTVSEVTQQRSDSADVDSNTTSKLDAATNIIKNFTNPTRFDGEKAAAAETMASELGVSVRVVRSTDEIGDSERDARRKRSATGWYDRSSSEIAVVLPNCVDEAEVQKTILHEAVGHYGIRELLGRERANELYRRVFDAVKDTPRAQELLVEHRSEIVTGDEYLAEMAEGNVTLSAMRRMLAAIRAFFREVVGIDLKLTDADLRYILWRSRHNLQGTRTVSEAMETIGQDMRMRRQTEHESARERKAARLEKLRASEPIQIIGNTPDLNRQEVKTWLRNNIRGNYTNTDTGEIITVSNVGINEVTSHGMTHAEHLQSLAVIPQMLERSIFIDEQANVKGNDKYEHYRYYVCGLKIGNTDYTAKVVVGIKDGHRYYDHRLTQIEKGALIDNLNRLSNSVAENQDSPVSKVKDKRLLSVLQPEPLKYQQQVAKNARPVPRTPMEYVDRVAEEMAAEENEVRFRRKKQEPAPDSSIRTTRDNWATNIGRKLQDANIPVRQLQEYITKQGGKVSIENDLYSALNRAPGRATERIKRIDTGKFIPLSGVVGKISRQLEPQTDAEGEKISAYKQISDYVAAKSAQERHRSGIKAYSEELSNPWNREYVENTIRVFEETVSPELLDKLWGQIRDITGEQLEMSKNYGLITTQTYRDIRERGWKYYVPLQGIDFDFEGLTDPHDVFGDILPDKKGSGEGKLFHRAKGRITKPEDVLGTLQRNVHRTILAGERNAARQFLLRLVDANPELQGDPRDGKHIFRIESRWFVRNPIDGIFDEMVTRPSDEAIAASNDARQRKKKLKKQLQALKPDTNSAIPEDDRLAEYLDKRKDLTDRIEAEEKNITVTTRPMEAGAYRGLSETEENAHTVTVRKNGVRYVVRLSDPAVANAINNNFEEFIGGWGGKVVDFIGKRTRTLASLSTSWNPEFIIPNNLRDAIWAGVYNAVDADGNFRGYIRNIPNSYASISRYHLGRSAPLTFNERAKYDIYTPEGAKAAQSEFGKMRLLDTYYDDFLMEGGLTGYAYMHDVKDYSRKLARKIKANATVPGAALGVINDAAGFMSDMSEISTRFATFLSQIQSGREVREAVNYAKNITINFNTRGEWGRGLNSLFMFYNASMQGVANVYRLTKRNPGRMAVVAASMLGLGYGMSLLLSQFLAAGGGEGEEWNISDYERYTNFIIPGTWFGSEDGYIKIPIPMELRPFWISGVVANDLNQGKIQAEDAWKTILQASSDAFSPLEVSADHPFKMITPTLFKPILEVLVWNEDFAGRQINRTPFTKSQIIPDSQLGQRNANIISKSVTEWLNELGGGNPWTPAGRRKDGSVNEWQNWLDISPSTLDHLAASYTGGLGRMLFRTFDFITTSGDERSARNWPVFNRFYGEVRKEINPSTRYYDLRSKYQSRHDLFRNNAKNGHYPPFYNSAQEAKADYAHIEAVLNKMKPYDKALSRMKQMLGGVEYGSEEYKRITKEMNRVKADFIKEYDHAYKD